MHLCFRTALPWLVALALVQPLVAAEKGQPTLPAGQKLLSVAKKTAGLTRLPGLLDLYLDRERGQVFLELPAPGDGGVVGEYLYVEGLLTGLGSNPVGLDRGQLGETRVVRIRRLASRVLVEEENLRFRADTPDVAERRAVAQSFATSVLWGSKVVALDSGGRALVDFTGFVVRDAHDVVGRLRQAGQGTFSLDGERSALEPDEVRAFPRNLELEAVLTFTSDQPGDEVRATAPTPSAVTLVQHHSLIALPEPGYQPRTYQTRAGSFAVAFKDYAAPLGAPLEKRWIVRHRLERTDAGAERSPAVEPLVYYVDPATPEPVRSALVEGASWWADAFAAAGFEDAFRVEILPEDADPLDVRYNVIQWVHRSTRGWSYGGGVIDPRTGEMIKGHVSLGSLRVRQDIRILQGLTGADATGTGGPNDPEEVALARIRQLAAHEVGHTLGLAHNFAASTYGRASVMDYPAPLVRVTEDGSLDLSQAYARGVGSWDVFAIRFAYGQPEPGESEEDFEARLLAEARQQGLLFLSDQDARPPGAAEPLANLWDNGEDPVAELDRLMGVRKVALEHFGRDRVAEGQPLALLQETLVPVYLLHRYQLAAAGKSVGGVVYEHAVRGDGYDGAIPVAATRQREAVAALLRALQPAALDLPDSLLGLLLPRPPGFTGNRELFDGRSDPVFDPLGAAETAASLVVRELLQPQRLARMVDQHRRAEELPGAAEVLSSLVDATFGSADPSPRRAELQRVVQGVVVDGMLTLATDAAASPEVRARAHSALEALRAELSAVGGEGVAASHRKLLAYRIARYLDHRPWQEEASPEVLPPPPGDPIGGGCSWGSGPWIDSGGSG